jgi:type I restriction enzyme S subunit
MSSGTAWTQRSFPRWTSLHLSASGICSDLEIYSCARAECFYQKAIHRVRPRLGQESPRFFSYLMYSLAKRGVFAAGGNPNTIDHLTGVQLRHYRLPFAPPVEQRAIAAVLDRETARIDALVAKKERLIDLLQEKRTALITRAVTKGLDPTVPMKDSGVEWLGEIPAHWEVKPLRWAISVRSGEALSSTEFELTREEGREVPVIGGNGVMGYSDRGNTSAACIAIGRVGALCGNVHPIEPPAWVTDNALLVADIIGFDRQYLALFLRVLDLNRWASQNAQPLITGGFVKEQQACSPPVAEQRAIAAFLDRETARIDALVAKVRDAIEHLKELRTALISAAVTGKIDVREEATA